MGASMFPVPLSGIQQTTLTTTGDMIYATAANTAARIGIGSSAQVLTVASGVPSWATPTSGLTLVRRSTFTSVADTSTTFDGVFTSTYKAYKIVIETLSNASASTVLRFSFRVGASTQASLYRGGYFGANESGMVGVSVDTDAVGASLVPISNAGMNISGELFISQVVTSNQPKLTGTFNNPSQYSTYISWNVYRSAILADGFILSSSVGNMTGTVSVYGLAAA